MKKPSAALPTSSLSVLSELFGRAAMIGLFASLGTLKALTIGSLLAQWPALNTAQYLDLASHIASAAFIVLVVAATLFRLKPIKSAEGLEPRISALIGAFLSLSLVALPLVDAGPTWRATAISLIMAGGVLSTWVLFWLGRSFSLTPQARRLVTIGPYAIVRHPLYLCEEIAVIGVAMLYFSPIAVAIVFVHWLFQLRRMTNEERVLGSEFPEYKAYAAATPKLIPNFYYSRAVSPEEHLRRESQERG